MLFVMTIDTEEEWDWDQGWPTGDPRLANIAILPRFQDLCDRHGVATTYLVNQAVLDDDRSADVIARLAQGKRVEIGMHIHPWNTPPIEPGPVTSRESFLANLSPATIRAKLESVYASHRRRGFTPTSFRGGRYSSGGPIHEFLRDHGFRVDSSIVPFTYWDEPGAPDFRDQGLEPRRSPPRRAGDHPFWEVPLSMGFTRRPMSFWRTGYHLVEHSPLRHLRLIGIAERLGLVRKVWLNFESPLGDHMLAFFDLLAGWGIPCAVFTVHSSSLMVGGNPWSRTAADVDRMFAQLDQVFAAVARRSDCRPATLSQIATQLEEDFHAHPRH